MVELQSLVKKKLAHAGIFFVAEKVFLCVFNDPPSEYRSTFYIGEKRTVLPSFEPAHQGIK